MENKTKQQQQQQKQPSVFRGSYTCGEINNIPVCYSNFSPGRPISPSDRSNVTVYAQVIIACLSLSAIDHGVHSALCPPNQAKVHQTLYDSQLHNPLHIFIFCFNMKTPREQYGCEIFKYLLIGHYNPPAHCPARATPT